MYSYNVLRRSPNCGSYPVTDTDAHIRRYHFALCIHTHAYIYMYMYVIHMPIYYTCVTYTVIGFRARLCCVARLPRPRLSPWDTVRRAESRWRVLTRFRLSCPASKARRAARTPHIYIRTHTLKAHTYMNIYVFIIFNRL